MPVSPAITNWNTNAIENSMGTSKRIFPPHMVASQLKVLMPGGDGDQHGRQGKERVAEGRHADGEHVVRPHAEADEGDAHRCRHHGRITEDRLAREHRNDLVREGECRQHEYVDLGMSEDPEEVRPQGSPNRPPGYRRSARPDSGQSAAWPARRSAGSRRAAPGTRPSHRAMAAAGCARSVMPLHRMQKTVAMMLMAVPMLPMPLARIATAQ